MAVHNEARENLKETDRICSEIRAAVPGLWVQSEVPESTTDRSFYAVRCVWAGLSF